MCLEGGGQIHASPAKPNIQQVDAQTEEHIQSAIELILYGKSNIKAIAAEHSVSYRTLFRHYKGLNQNKYKAQEARQLLTVAQEKVLTNWLILWANTSHAICQRALTQKAEALCGIQPSQKWLRLFKKRHQHELIVGWPTGLDPK